MPANDQNAPFDYRPVGAVAGASLPTVGLLEYLLREYPQYRKMLEAAPDATLPNGNVDLRKVLTTINPGDFGVSGLQGGGSTFTNALVHGSHGASGGVGAHGQIAGHYVRPHWKITGAEPGELGPALAYLMNERGELYSPEMATNPERFAKRLDADALDAGRGTEQYGYAKERLRSRTAQLAKAQARQKAWDTYDKAVRSGDAAAVRPATPRPSANELDDLLKSKTRSVSDFKTLLADIKKNSGNTQTGHVGTTRTGNPKAVWQTAPFFEGPHTAAKDFERQLQHMTDSASRHEMLARRFDEMGAKNPKLKAIADELRLDQPTMWDRLAKNLEARGVKTPTQQKTIEALLQAAGGDASALPRSALFKPKQFETFVPSLLHGGMHANAVQGMSPTDYAAFAAADTGEKLWQEGPSSAYKTMREWLADFSNFTKHQPARDAAQASKRPQTLFNPSADNVYKHTVAEGSSQNPLGYYRAGNKELGHKGTLWMRPKGNIDSDNLLQAFKQEAWKPYNATGAGGTALGEITGLNRLRGLFGRGGACTGHHCGSFIPAVYEAAGAAKPGGPVQAVLPNRAALSDIFEPVLVTHKGQMLKDLAKGAFRRTGAGLGAIGLMGAAGYGLTGLGQSFLRGAPKAPPKPQLDPTMFAKSMKLLQPQRV
jgi:hypothetical protein